MKKIKTDCPTCKKEDTWSPNNPARPFCSERCKLIDLGEWAEEKYKIPLDPHSSEDELSSDDSDK